MRLADVLRKERIRNKFSTEEMASRLSLTLSEYSQVETDSSSVEEWGMKLCRIAVILGVPISRLISNNGKAIGARLEVGQCGKLIKSRRESKGLTPQAFAAELEWSMDEVTLIEGGKSPLEAYAPLLLHFAEVINQPLFNLFYPAGVPLSKLQDYPS